jgi:hypothetical protein
MQMPLFGFVLPTLLLAIKPKPVVLLFLSISFAMNPSKKQQFCLFLIGFAQSRLFPK